MSHSASVSDGALHESGFAGPCARRQSVQFHAGQIMVGLGSSTPFRAVPFSAERVSQTVDQPMSSRQSWNHAISEYTSPGLPDVIDRTLPNEAVCERGIRNGHSDRFILASDDAAPLHSEAEDFRYLRELFDTVGQGVAVI